jgi:hypothetical protein
MPKYLVEMHDGRKFQVEADSQPSEAEVLAHMGGSAPTGPKTVSPDEPGTFMGGFAQSVRDTASKVGHGFVEGLNPLPVLKSMWDNSTDSLPYQPNDTPAAAAARLKAHDAPTGPSMTQSVKGLSDPETGGQAIGNLTQALITGRLVSAAQNPAARVAVGRGMQAIGNNLDITKPAKLLATAGEALERSGTPPLASPAAPTGPHMDRSVPVQPSALTQQQLRERIFQGSGTPPVTPEKPMIGVTSQAAPVGQPPITVAPESPMQPPADSPLQQPRVQVGAEVVGRQNGLTKEAVRQQTGPLFTEAPGSASPVVPQNPFERMHDKLLSMGHGNPERDAYVQAAGDPKTAGQLEIMRRTLERNGLSVAAATSMAEAIRRQVMARLGGRTADQ